jgi:hypothetical protein
VGVVASHAVERKMENHLAGREEGNGPDSCNDADEQRQAEQTSLGSETPMAEFQEFREPA